MVLQLSGQILGYTKFTHMTSSEVKNIPGGGDRIRMHHTVLRTVTLRVPARPDPYKLQQSGAAEGEAIN